MKIIRVTKHSEKELLNALRQVSLLHDATVFPYKNAQIQLEEVRPSDIHPSQFYFLEDAVLKIADLQQALKAHSIDIFHLDGYVEYEIEDGSLFTLLPPIVEYQKDEKGNTVPLLNDGIHRILYAQKENQPTLQVVMIKNADEKYPLMGYPNPHGWNDVKAVEKAPDPKDKRIWRVAVEQGYLLYRNFNSAFSGVGKPRQSNQK